MQTDFSVSAIGFAELSLNEMTTGGPRTHNGVFSGLTVLRSELGIQVPASAATKPRPPASCVAWGYPQARK
jgi:hypothetical protein